MRLWAWRILGWILVVSFGVEVYQNLIVGAPSLWDKLSQLVGSDYFTPWQLVFLLSAILLLSLRSRILRAIEELHTHENNS